MSGPESHPIYEFAEFRLDTRRRLLSHADGKSIAVTSKGFDALVYLVERAGEVIPRAVLTKALWPDTVVEENNLNVVVSTLRRALGDEPPLHRYIATVAGRGYQFVADERKFDEVAPETRAPAAQAPTTSLAPGPRIRIAVAAAVVISVALLAAYGGLRPAAPESASARDEALEPAGSVSRVSAVTTYVGDETTPSLSPDGGQVAFAWDGGIGNIDIYVTRIGAQSPLRLTTSAARDHDPAWSPDGSRIAFVRQYDPWQSDIIVVPALGGPERTLRAIRTSFLLTVRSPPLLAWSSDGTQLLFTTQTDEQGDVATGYGFQLLSLETGLVRPLPLEGDGYDTSPAFSPDGKRLAFTRYGATTREGQLMVQDLGPGLVPSGAPHPVPGAWLGDPRSPSWSPDGERLMFVRGTEILEWTDGGATRLVYAASGELAALSTVRREGRSFAVASKVESDLDIWSLPIDPETHTPVGPPLALVQSTAREQHPRFSPDGRHLAFVSWRGGGPDVWLSDADGRNPRQLSTSGAADPGHPRWSPDGTQIAFDAWTPNDTPHVYLVDVDEGLPTLVTAGSVTGWSADSEHLYVTELAGVLTVARFRLSDGRREELFLGAGAHESADGKQIFYSKPNESGIFARSLSGDIANNAEERVVDDYWFPPSAGFQPVEQGIFYVSYTPAGRARALRFFDYAQGTATDIATLPAHAAVVWGLSVSPDHREVLYAIPESGADLVLLEF